MVSNRLVSSQRLPLHRMVSNRPSTISGPSKSWPAVANMRRSVVLAGLMLVLGGAPLATILDQVEIGAKAGGVKIRHPILQSSGTLLKIDQNRRKIDSDSDIL
jgi:hypothetical protein